jgi:FRG domain
VTADSRTPNAVGWQRMQESDGIVTFRLASWSNYFDFLEAELFHESIKAKHKYIWRGQRMNWPLSSSLDRLFKKLSLMESPNLEKLTAEHLESFKFATRGRRGLNPAELLENEWWALGQHFGLATPLLDWTRSPFAAAYFAFEELATDPSEHRILYGLDLNAVSQRNKELDESKVYEQGRPPILEIIEPMSDENPRLVSQGGLFTRAPIGTSIEQWVEGAFGNSSGSVLLRIEIPNTDRLACLRALNRMNINHLSLFPDLGGASRSTNLKLEIDL